MSRSLFSMDLGEPPAREILERRYDGERVALLQRITEAAYFGRGAQTWWKRLLGRPAPGVLVPPFDEAGRDVFSLTAEHVPVLDGDDDPLGTIRSARGIVTALLPRERGDDVVVRDAWLDGGHRLTSAVHFGLALPGMAPVAVAFAMSPLVIAQPTRAPLEQVLTDVSPEVRRRWSSTVSRSPSDERDARTMAAREASLVELRVDDELEVRGVVTTPEHCLGRFDLEGRTTSYRDAPRDLGLVVGDRPGLRMVLVRHATG